ncbi:Pyridoxal phosphate-dependent transferase [Elaphomyces granulatus]
MSNSNTLRPRNLEQALDRYRVEFGLMTAKPRWDDSVIDLTSSDFLSLSRSGRIREGVKEELERQGEYLLSASGSRAQFGNYDYLLEVEREIAKFHNAETAWIAHSGFFACAGVIEASLLPGDANSYMHASTHVGMKVSTAAHKLSFRHNDPVSLRDVLTSLKDRYPAFRSGTQSILICVESIYSMDGDICPFKECVNVAKELFPLGNAQFFMDEAHSSGVLGPNGAGLVQMLGLEKEIAIRVHVCSKALGSTGGVILCNKTIRHAIMHQSRFASIRVGYAMLASGETKKTQDRIQTIVKYFFHKLTNDPVWEEAVDAGLLSCPLAEDWEQRQCHSHIVPIRTRPRHEQYLFFHMSLAGMNAYNISYPVVPKGSSRIRMVFHAHNTEQEVDTAVAAICGWAAEMLEIEDGASNATLPKAALQVYAVQAALA